MIEPLNVSFDTNAFDSNQFDLSDNSTLGQLVKYCRRGDINIFLSNVVINEMRNHCVQYAELISSKVKRTIKAIRKGDLLQDEAEKKKRTFHNVSDEFTKVIGYSGIVDIPPKEKVIATARSYFDSFLESLNPTEISAVSVDVEKIIADYFQLNPPFENKETKKNEFPDAIIAEQIKKHFSNESHVYFVTEDTGLIAALDGTPYCHIVSSFGELFSIINNMMEEEKNEALAIITSAIPQITKVLEARLEDDDVISLDGLSYDSNGVVSGFDYTDVRFNECAIDDVKLFTLDYFDKKVIAARFRCLVQVTAECSYEDYDNAAWDSEEKEYLYLDTITNIEKHSGRFPCSVIYNRETGEVQIPQFHVYFGNSTRLGSPIRKIKNVDSRPFTTCPDCGADISIENDGGNGFCINCAPKH